MMESRRVKSRRRQRGSTLVESAFVAPVFFILIFGVIEFGLLFKDKLTTDNASRVGGRAASVTGAGDESDFLVLQSVGHGLNSMNRSQVTQIIIYKATTPQDPVPADCLTGGSQSGPEFCNVYDRAALDELFYDTNGVENDFFGCVAGTSADRFWCPNSRDDSLTGAPPDYVGVYVETEHAFITGFFGNGVTLTQTAVNRIEPTG